MVVTGNGSSPSYNSSEQQSLLYGSDKKTASNTQIIPVDNNRQHHEINPNYDVAAAAWNGQQQQPLPTSNLQIREQKIDPYYSSRVTDTSCLDLCCSSGVSLFLVLFIVSASISQIICEIVVYPNYYENTLVQILPRVLVYVPLGLSILYYIILVFTCSTAKYLFNNKDASSIYDNVDKLTRARPTISLYVSCYHYETRIETYTDSEGNTKTRTYEERVTTYSETRAFNYNYFRDVSKPFL